MVESLVFLTALFLVLVVAPLLFGADSRDGEDWVRHPRI
jgi:hypothetical protein